MTSQLTPYITFDGTAREAMEFYRSALGGELAMNTFSEYGETGAAGEKIMHARLDTPDGFTLMASDTPPGMEPPSGSSISISLSGEDADRLRGCWEALAQGAEVTMPLERQMWGDDYGQLTDRFGIRWMVNIAGTPQE